MSQSLCRWRRVWLSPLRAIGPTLETGGKNVFQCFQADRAVHGNLLDFWAALHRLPLNDAALNLADTFHLPRNREEEPAN